MSDYWPTELVWSWVKNQLTKKVTRDHKFKKGCGTHAATQQREAHSEATASVVLLVRCTRCGAQHREEVTRPNVS